jgi:hypothetical protein
MTSDGFASRGQYAVHVAHWWQSQMDEFPSARSLSPHWTQTISFRGNGLSAVEIGHTTEQVPHW